MAVAFVVLLAAVAATAIPFEQTVLSSHNGWPKTPLPVANSTKSFWIDTPGANPLAKHGSTGPLTAEADVCIIGSGISGASAAYELSAQHGLDVVVFEARDFCSGATGRNGGHLTTYVFQGFENLAKQYGVEQAKAGFVLENYTSHAIVEIVEENDLVDVVDLVHGGHTSIMMTAEIQERRKKDFNAARDAGVDVSSVKWYSGQEMQTAFGTNYPGFTFDAYNIWPLKFATQLFKIAEQRLTASSGSLSLHTNTPVTDVRPLDSDGWDVVTLRGSTACRYVLHTTNAYAGHLLPSMRGPAGIVPTRGQIIAVKSKNTGKSSWTNGDGEYWFPRPGPDTENPLVILGGGRSHGGDSDIVDDSVLNPQVSKSLRDFLPNIFGAERREPEMEWTGIMGYTATNDPFVGPLDPLEGSKAKGQYISAGFAGHGMPRTFSCARAVVSMIVADMKNESWVQPEWLPDRYLTENRV